MNTSDLAAWSLVDQFLSNSTLWGSNSFVVKVDRLLGWTAEEFDLSPTDADDPQMLRQRIRRWSNLSRLADLIPRNSRITHDGALLSETVRKILTQGECAAGISLSKKDKKNLEAAAKVLIEPGDNGLPQPSQKSKAYTLYKSKYYTAEQALRTADLQAASSGDIVKVQDFQEIVRPELVAAIAAAKLEWITLGFKNDVEEARALQLAFAERAPIETWSRFRDQFSSAELKDLDGADFYPVRTTPNNANDLLWQAAQVQVPIDVKYKFASSLSAAGTPQINFDRVEFEYAFLRIDRAWLDSSNSALNSRIWRHPDYKNNSISDGKAPPSGECPGFSIGFILVRSLRAFSAYTTTKISTGSSVHVSNAFKDLTSAIQSSGNPSMSGAIHSLSGIGEKSSFAEFKELIKDKGVFFEGEGLDLHKTPSQFDDLVIADLNENKSQPKKPVSFEDRIWDARDFPPKSIDALTPAPVDDEVSDASLEQLIKRLKLNQPGTLPKFEPTKSSINVATTASESVRNLIPENRIILGGILCKSIPKMPDPDPGLIWN